VDAVLEDPRSLILVLSHLTCKYASIKTGGEFDVRIGTRRRRSPHAKREVVSSEQNMVLAFASFDSITTSN
jgi:hypothetical protein